MTPNPSDRGSPPEADDPVLVGGTPAEVFRAFLKLGLTSFGGPVAHLGYFRDELVVRRKWIDESEYSDLVALCQFLPGPASSQVGYALGLLRGGALGGLAAWCGFTLPSALLLLLFALGASHLEGTVGAGLIHGLKLVAVAVVAHAVWSMARALIPDWQRGAIAVGAILVLVLLSGPGGQVAAILIGGLAGLCLRRSGSDVPSRPLTFPITRRAGFIALVAFVVLLGGLPLASTLNDAHELALLDVFYRSGALVFGGGHVVLPLLEEGVVRTGWIGSDDFLAGYGAAQAVPGPLFTFAAFLGAAMELPPNAFAGAMICLVAIFAPGILLVTGVLPFWSSLRARPLVQAAMRGANAAVVGVLASALYDPLWTTTILSPGDFAIAFVGFVSLVVLKWPPWAVVLMTAASSVALALL
jgi:chromate transporter